MHVERRPPRHSRGNGRVAARLSRRARRRAGSCPAGTSPGPDGVRDGTGTAPWRPARGNPDPARTGTGCRALEAPRERPSRFQRTSAPRVVTIVAATASARLIRPDPDSAPARAEQGRRGAAVRPARQKLRRRGRPVRTGREGQASEAGSRLGTLTSGDTHAFKPSGARGAGRRRWPPAVCRLILGLRERDDARGSWRCRWQRYIDGAAEPSRVAPDTATTCFASRSTSPRSSSTTEVRPALKQ